MAWKDISSSVYNATFNCDYNIEANGNVFVTLQYSDNPEYLSPTSVRLRLKLNSRYNNNHYDKYYILLGQSKNGKLFKIKDEYTKSGTHHWGETSKDDGAYITDGFNISKNYNDEKFTIPALYIINNGNSAVSISTAADAYNAATGSRKQLTSSRNSTSIAIAKSSTVATDATVGTVTITDNKDNTFTITGTKGTAGTNNPIESASIEFGYTSSLGSAFPINSSSASQTFNLTITDTSKATRAVYARNVMEATYNSSKSSTVTVNIKQYVKPSNPGTPELSYEKSRLTVKENWRYTWGAATKANDSSPIVGHRIRIYKNGTAITGLTSSTDSTVIGKGTGTTSYVDRDSTSRAILFNPVTLGFKAGDKVKASIQAYTKDGKSTKLLSSAVISAESVVQNAGIVNVKVGGAWKEGQVYVKVSGSWKEAESVSTKVSGAWKEAN